MVKHKPTDEEVLKLCLASMIVDGYNVIQIVEAYEEAFGKEMGVAETILCIAIKKQVRHVFATPDGWDRSYFEERAKTLGHQAIRLHPNVKSDDAEGIQFEA